MTAGEVDFPQLVKRIREVRGLTQEAFARELDVTFSTVNTWENGKHRPQRHFARQLLKLAEKLGITPVLKENALPRRMKAVTRKRGRRKGDA